MLTDAQRMSDPAHSRREGEPLAVGAPVQPYTRYGARAVDREGEYIFTVCDHGIGLSARVWPGHGATCLRFVRNFGPVARRQSVEALEPPPSLDHLRRAPLAFGMPLLFPASPALRRHGDLTRLACAIAAGSDAGLVASARWTVEAMEQTPTGARIVCALRSSDHAEWEPGFAPDFLMRVSTQMSDHLLTREVRVANLDRVPMPLDLGTLAHLQIPAAAGDSTADARLLVLNGAGQMYETPLAEFEAAGVLADLGARDGWRELVVRNPANDYDLSLRASADFGSIIVVPRVRQLDADAIGSVCVGLWTFEPPRQGQPRETVVVAPGQEWRGSVQVRLHERGVSPELELERRGNQIVRAATLSAT